MLAATIRMVNQAHRNESRKYGSWIYYSAAPDGALPPPALYLIDHNGAATARRAGYPQATAKQRASAGNNCLFQCNRHSQPPCTWELRRKAAFIRNICRNILK